jgi:hypothetical protein
VLEVYLDPGHIQAVTPGYAACIVKAYGLQIFMPGIFQVVQIVGVVYMPVGIAFVGAYDKFSGV